MYNYTMANNIYASISNKEPLSKYVLALQILENSEDIIKMEVFDNPNSYSTLLKTLKEFKDDKGNCLSMHMIENCYGDTHLEYLFNLFLNPGIHKNTDGNTIYLLNLLKNEPFRYVPSDEELNTMNNDNKAPLDIKPNLTIPGKLLLDGETLIHINVDSLDQSTIYDECQRLFAKYKNNANLKGLKFLISKGITDVETTSLEEAHLYFLHKGIYDKTFFNAVKKIPNFDNLVKEDSSFLIDHFRDVVNNFYNNGLQERSSRMNRLIEFMNDIIDKLDCTGIEPIPEPDNWFGHDDIKNLVERINRNI